MATHKVFVTQLIAWHSTHNKRQLPWKGISDPYKIWVSEIMLQQTKADTVVPYYNKFIKAYPSIKALAKAQPDEVFKLWQGLGYYSRCRNLLKGAQLVATQYKGILPANYNLLLSIPGIGNYTAAAIASFAFGLPYAVCDGNVYRILSRYFNIQTPIDTTLGKKEFTTKAQALITKQQPAMYNQAIMDFGAQVCLPKKPLCAQCMLSKTCNAFKANTQLLLPVKSKTIKVAHRYFHYLVFCNEGNIYLQQRTAQDIWQHLYEPYLIETTSNQLPHTQYSKLITGLMYQDEQRLTHVVVHTYYYLIIVAKNIKLPNTLLKIKLEDLPNYPVSKSINSFLLNHNYIR
jgi:A/G-specific adenine glycosylase